jgi:KDO2-lipid IV(A) lauroyltransferase
MAKERSLPFDYAVYLLVRIFVCLIQALPIHVAAALADGLAWLAYTLDRRHRQVAEDNLRHAFPEITSPAEIDVRVRAVFRHFCRLVIDIAFLPRKLHTNNWQDYVDMRDAPQLTDRLTTHRPVLLLSGHFGNWEMGGWTMGLLGFRTWAVARDLDNPFLERFIRRFRQGSGQRLLSKTGDAERMQAILAAGGVLGTLADQDAGQRGLYVNFLNRPASTHKAVALLALQHRVPTLVAGVRKLDQPLHYKVFVEDVILPEEYEGRPGAVKEMTQRFTSALERVIRTAPEQYFWLHRRWKHQPKAKKGKQAA